MEQEKSPESLLEFIVIIIKAYITGIPSIIKSMIISVIFSAVVTNAIHFYLMGWVNNGWNNAGNPWLDPMIFLTGQGPAKVMLFYFMVTYLFWWVIGMFRSRGVGSTVKMIATSPIWIVKSLTSIGFAVFPMLMGGLAVSFVMGLTVLTNPTAITMFLMMITVLISQEESLIVMGLQLAFKDVSGLVKRGNEPRIPSAHVPSAAIIGAGVGFGYIAFLKPSATVIAGIAVLSVAGLVYMFIRNRRSPEVAIVATLFVLLSAVAVMSPRVFADDGGIPENGGWSNLPNLPWLIQELIEKGYPASIAATIAATIISGMFSKPVLSKIKPLTDKHVEPDWSWATKDGKVDLPPEFVKDSNGTWVHNVTGEKYRKDQTGNGLSKAIIDAEDSSLLGNKVRVYTMEPPKDQGLLDDISEGINGLDPFYTDKLHPDNWKNMKPGQKGVVMQELNKVLQKEFGVEYEFKVTNDADKLLGGYYSPGSKTISLNANGNDFDDPRTAIRTLIHEARHAYQDQKAKNSGEEYQKMCEYNNANKNYQTSDHDYVRYAEQFIEKDSRKFSHNATNELIERLNEKWGH